MNYTQIKRLFQNQTEFVPITLAEAVVVNTSNIPGLAYLNITTLDKVLKNTLGLIGTNINDIQTLSGSVLSLSGLVQTINDELQNKQDKLTAGVGIDIRYDDDTGKTTISATHSLTIYLIVTSLLWESIKDTPGLQYENVIYLVPQPQNTSINGNIFKEFLCIIENGSYKWEEFGTILTDIDLSGYVSTQVFLQLSNEIRATGVFAENVTTSLGSPVVVQYTIPYDLYDSAVLEQVNTDEIITPNSGENP